MHRTRLLVMVVAASMITPILSSGVAVAQQAVLMRKNATECEIATALGVNKPGCPAVAHPATPAKKWGGRGLGIGSPNPAATDPAVAQPQFAAAFQVNFEFASARLTPDAAQVLDKIGAVMTAPDAANVKFQLTGHTDSIGTAQRNLQLSKDRAQAAKEYLVNNFSIAGSRLLVQGRGATELLNSMDPTAAENRRVEIANLGG